MHELIKEVQAIAQTGLHYCTDDFDRERYQRLREISYELIATLSGSTIENVEEFFLPERGYATPKVDLRGCIVQHDKVLLVRERSDGKWTLPGGWADQNESPREGIVREIEEESGYKAGITGLYAVKDRDRREYQPRYPVSIYKMFFAGTVIGGAPAENLEIDEIGFFGIEELPELSRVRVLEEDIVEGLEYIRGRGKGVICD